MSTDIAFESSAKTLLSKASNALNLKDLPNEHIAERLREYADLLQDQGANAFRVRAYRNAADTVQTLDDSIVHFFAKNGWDGLVHLPGIGKGIASAIVEMLLTGHWAQSERLKGKLTPERLFQSIPGIGPTLAARLVNDHHLESLQELEGAVHDQSKSIRGLGSRRRDMIAAVLAERLKHSVGEGARLATPAPSTITLLDLDARYRMAVEADTLVKIKPLRNNPQNSYWLPVMHETHDGWHFTVMFSNTTRAHELGKTRDWVVIYYQKEGFPEGRCTVVTEYQGQRKGQRVVRGGVVAATAAQ